MWTQRFVAGDAEAFEKIIDHYKAYVFAIVLRFLQDPDDVQDVVQEVFLQLYRSLPGYQPDNLKGWIGKITANKAIDWKRRQSRFLWDSEKSLSTISEDADAGPERVILKKERDEYIKALCTALPQHYSRIVIKYHFEDKSYQQIAREEGISLKTVESRLYRARKILKERWKEEMHEAL